MPVDLEALSAAGAQILGDLGWRKRPAQRLQDAAFLALEAAGSTPQVRATVACAAARAILEDALGEEAPDFADTTVLDEALSFLLFVAANVLAAKAAPGELSTAIREAAAAQAAFRSASRSPAPSNHPSNHPSNQGSQKEDDAHLVAALRRLGLQPPVVGKRVRKQPSADPPPPPKRAPPKRTKDDDYDDNGDNDDEDEDEFDEEGDEEEEEEDDEAAEEEDIPTERPSLSRAEFGKAKNFLEPKKWRKFLVKKIVSSDNVVDEILRFYRDAVKEYSKESGFCVDILRLQAAALAHPGALPAEVVETAVLTCDRCLARFEFFAAKVRFPTGRGAAAAEASLLDDELPKKFRAGRRQAEKAQKGTPTATAKQPPKGNNKPKPKNAKPKGKKAQGKEHKDKEEEG